MFDKSAVMFQPCLTGAFARERRSTKEIVKFGDHHRLESNPGWCQRFCKRS